MSRTAFALYLTSLALIPWGRWLNVPALHEHAQWSDLALAGAGVCWLTAHWRHPLRSLGLPPVLVVAPAAYVLWAAASHAAAGLEPRAGTFKLLGLASLAVLFWLTAHYVSQRGRFPWIARVVAATSLAAGALAAVEAAAGWLGHPLWPPTFGDLAPGSYARAQAGFIHPNLLASYCIVAAAVIGHPRSGLPRRIALAGQALLGAACALALSREIIGFALALLIRRAEGRGRWLAASCAVAAVALQLTLTLAPPSLDPTRPLEARLGEGPSVRRGVLVGGLRSVAAHPLFGRGPANPPARFQRADWDAHCTPVNVAASYGLPGLLAFGAIPLGLWRRREQPTDRVLWGALAGLALGSLAQDIEDFRHLWLALGLATASNNRAC